MVVKFKDGLYNNYTQQNIIDILSVAAQKNFLIYNLMMSPYDYILVEGDIHRSQWTADNIGNNYWLKIKGFASNGYPIKDLSAAHIYVCFRQVTFNYHARQYMIGVCANPEPYKGTDIADISNLNGQWEFVNITYGITKSNHFNQQNATNTRKIKTPPRKRLEIIDPKTGKPINVQSVPSVKQTPIMVGGGNKLPADINKMKLKDNEVKLFVKEIEGAKTLTIFRLISSFMKIINKRPKKKSTSNTKTKKSKSKSKK